MQFCDKINFLFELTHAEGKELASVMSISPPQISKMRKGIRGLPRNNDSARLLANFFAHRCNSELQRDALSKTVRVAQIRNIDNENALTDIILDWLANEQDPDDYAARRADDFLRQFGSLFESDQGNPLAADTDKTPVSGRSSFFAYYGDDGKRLAVQSFLNYILQRKLGCTINILTDESIAWSTDDVEYSRRLHATMANLTEIGCDFRRIAGPILDMEQAFESLNRWFPFYTIGKATSYYYKRLRDNLNRLTLMVVPDVAVLFSFSVGQAAQHDGVTFFTVDSKTVNAMAREFENYLALCEPIMNVYTTGDQTKRLHNCMMSYESAVGACIQRSNSLSFITLPWDVAMSLHSVGQGDDKSDFLTSFAQRYKKFKTNLEQYPFIDIIRLADVDTVMAGKEPIPASVILGSQLQYYSAAGYLQHLRSVLYLLQHRDNYHVVLREAEDADAVITYVKEGYCAILARYTRPFAIFEVSERYLVDAFMEYLRRQVPTEFSEATRKRAAIAEIRALINQIEKRVMEAK